MRHLGTLTQPDIGDLNRYTQFTRLAARAIAVKDREVLLVHTKRYDDYSLPGGGLDTNEDILTGLVRELNEETGAQNICNFTPFGVIEEYRNWYKPDFDLVHMVSKIFRCDVDRDLGLTSYEDYEVKNGMTALWIDIDRAINHNLKTLQNFEKKGVSIEREIFLLKLIKTEIIAPQAKPD